MPEKEPTVVIWAKERDNYVTPLKIVALQIKSPAKFGWKTSPYVGIEDGRSGELFSLALSTLESYRPTVLDIVDPDSPVKEFLSNMNGEHFFERVRWLRVHETNLEIADLCSIIHKSKSLAVVEIFEPKFGIDERRQMIQALSTKSDLKGFDFIFDFEGAELNDYFQRFRMKLSTVRFSGYPGVKLSALKSINVEMPLTEFAALQDINIDINTDHPNNKNWHRDLLNRFCHIFSSLKFFFLDYKVFDTVFIYEDDTVRIFEAIRDFFFRMKLVCMAILIYCPDDDMKASVSKAVQFLAKDSDIRTEKKEFFCGAASENVSPNFALLVLGDQVHARTVRLVETIVDQRITIPDLRHFSYIMDLEAFLRPDSTIAFGGFDKETVIKTYQEKHISSSTPDFVPDTVMQRYVNG